MNDARPSIRLDGDENAVISVTWGRSGKRAIITISDPRYENARQVLLAPEQADQLGRFLSAGPEG